MFFRKNIFLEILPEFLLLLSIVFFVLVIVLVYSLYKGSKP